MNIVKGNTPSIIIIIPREPSPTDLFYFETEHPAFRVLSTQLHGIRQPPPCQDWLIWPPGLYNQTNILLCLFMVPVTKYDKHAGFLR